MSTVIKSYDLANLFRETEHAIRGRDARRLAITRKAINRVIYSSDLAIRDAQVVLDSKEELEASSRKITKMLFQLNRDRVKECMAVATGFVESAECELNIPYSVDAHIVVRRVTRIIASAREELTDTEVRPYLKTHLAPFADHVKKLRNRLSQVASQNTAELTGTRIATQRREEAERREAAEELEAQQAAEREHELAKRAARARQEQLEEQRVIEGKAHQVKALVDQFDAVYRSKDQRTAEDIYREINGLGKSVHAFYFRNREMDRMKGKLESLKLDLHGTKIRAV